MNWNSLIEAHIIREISVTNEEKLLNRISFQLWITIMRHFYLFILCIKELLKKRILHTTILFKFFFLYPLNSNLEVPQIHGRGRKRINFVRRGCNNCFTMAHRERIHCVQSPPALETWKSWIFRCVPADIYVPSLHNSILPWQDRCLE